MQFLYFVLYFKGTDFDYWDVLTMLIDDADIAGWNNEGLPGDRMSIENATILTNCDRWPLMIDPQLQGMLF